MIADPKNDKRSNYRAAKECQDAGMRLPRVRLRLRSGAGVIGIILNILAVLLLTSL